ncbi:MAG: YbbR-like domain-containing protein [Bacteroidales bacterium]|nr:YbbR-like domain-containing protein [Bacteroidales bacterium]
MVITGPKSIVDTIAEIRTKPQSLNLLSETVTVDLPFCLFRRLPTHSPMFGLRSGRKFTEITLEFPHYAYQCA